MTKGLLVLDPLAFDWIYGDNLLNEIASRIHLIAERPVTKQELANRLDLLQEAEVIFSGWGMPVVDEAFLKAAPRLQAVFYGAGSIKAFTPPAFWDRKIAITSAYAMNAIPVAEYTVATILFSLKNGWRYALGAKRLGAFPERIECAGGYRSKVGVISFGMIGRAVRERLRFFEADVLVYDPYLSAEHAAEAGVKLVSLNEIFESCDVVSLHSPWLKETEGMVTGALLGSMKQGATFINTARGALVNEGEMISVLTQRPDLTAVLDVTYPDEPPVAGSPLYSLPNVVLTPHIAGAQGRECRRLGQLMIEEFDRWSSGKPMKWAISREKSELLA